MKPMATKINQEPSDWRDGWTYTARQRIVDALAVVLDHVLCYFSTSLASSDNGMIAVYPSIRTFAYIR